MPKWKGSYDSGRRYNKSWEERFVWVSKADGSENAFCKLCRVQVAPKVSRLADHEKSKGHSNRVNSAKNTMQISFTRTKIAEEKTKKLEIELAVAISCHCSTLAVDHLGEFMQKNGKGSALEDLQLHRTKCSKLITKVVSPALHESLKSHVAEKKYAILIDESTDISTNKHLCVLIRYYSESKAIIATDYVGLLPVVGAKGSELFASLKAKLLEMGLKMSDCIGFASDGASAMIGQHDSVWSRVKAESPDCQLNRCICHSLALCTEKAFEKLPSNLGYLLAEIPKWFSKSIIRREAFVSLFKLMDPSEERKGTPLPFKKMSATRWLVRGKVISNILVNWQELKAYFACVLPTADASCRYKARELLDMLSDTTNLLYFYFISPVVNEFEQVNAFFQAKDADPEEMVQELDLHYKSLQDRLFDGQGNRLPIHKVGLGAKFGHELQLFAKNNPLQSAKVHEIQQRCTEMLVEALNQVEKRLPPSTAIFKGLSSFSPKRVLSQTARVEFRDLPMRHLQAENEDVIEQQYRKILHINWAEQSVFDGQIPQGTDQFWAGILQHKTASGNAPFRELALYALTCMTTPVSNAVVERVFSTLTNVKTKARNRLGSEMLDAIIRIRTHLQFQGKCCKDFEVTETMIELFTSDNMYVTAVNNDENGDDEQTIMKYV